MIKKNEIWFISLSLVWIVVEVSSLTGRGLYCYVFDPRAVIDSFQWNLDIDISQSMAILKLSYYDKTYA